MQKNLLFMMFLLMGSSLTFAQIQFEDFDWEELTNKAASENKLIMVDMTATWCGWCKFMDKNIFSKKKVGDYYNANFISTKLYDTHPMGSKFNSKYKVDGFPTMLFLDSKGKLVYTIGGAIQDVNAFISEGKSAKRKGAYVYNGGGNNGGGGNEIGGSEEQDLGIEEQASIIMEMVDNFDPNYEAEYQKFLKMPDVLNSITEMELTMGIAANGGLLGAKQIQKRRSIFEEEFSSEAVLEMLMSGAMIHLEENEVDIDFESDDFEQKLEAVTLPIFQNFIGDQTQAKALTYLMLGMLFAEAEMFDSSVKYLLKFAPYAPSILGGNTDDVDMGEFYTFIATTIYDEELTNYTRDAIKYGEKAVDLGVEYEIYGILSDLYAEIGDDANAQKYADLMEE